MDITTIPEVLAVGFIITLAAVGQLVIWAINKTESEKDRKNDRQSWWWVWCIIGVVTYLSGQFGEPFFL